MKNISDLKIFTIVLLNQSAVHELISLTSVERAECMTEAWDCGKEGLDVGLL